MYRSNRNKSGKPLELLFMLFFLVMTGVSFYHHPWKYYDFRHVSGSTPDIPSFILGFFAYLNHKVFLFFGWSGLIIPPSIAVISFYLLRGYPEKRVYRSGSVVLLVVILASASLAFIDSIYHEGKNLAGGLMGDFIRRQLPGGAWRIPAMLVFSLTAVFLICKHLFNINIFRQFWNLIIFISRSFERKRPSVYNQSGNRINKAIREGIRMLLPDKMPPVPTTGRRKKPKTVPWFEDSEAEAAGHIELSSGEDEIEVDDEIDTEMIEQKTGPAPGSSPRQKTPPPVKVSKTITIDLSPLKYRGDWPSPAVMGNLPTLPAAAEEDFDRTAKQIEQKLGEFKVPVEVEYYGSGPLLSIFTVEPARGVKIDDIVNRSKDISVDLGRGLIRFDIQSELSGALLCEVPRQHKSTIYYRDLIGDAESSDPIQPEFIAGVDIVGNTVTSKITDLPHLLVCGATGSGKSVFINSLISHLTLKYTSEDLRLVLMDAKQLELTPYEHLPHLALPVITEAKTAEKVLKLLVEEMEARYSLLNSLGYRNIGEYLEETVIQGGQKEICYALLIIDELADLLMVAGERMTELLVRLAQKSRAVGIHIIAATQRPSVDIISGLIKANFPSRIAFKTASEVDSRVILGVPGAETLMGKGDMFFMKPGQRMLRLHSGFLSTNEVRNYSQWWKLNNITS